MRNLVADNIERELCYPDPSNMKNYWQNEWMNIFDGYLFIYVLTVSLSLFLSLSLLLSLSPPFPSPFPPLFPLSLSLSFSTSPSLSFSHSPHFPSPSPSPSPSPTLSTCPAIVYYLMEFIYLQISSVRSHVCGHTFFTATSKKGMIHINSLMTLK